MHKMIRHITTEENDLKFRVLLTGYNQKKLIN